MSFLDELLTNSWIGRRGFIKYPLRLRYLTPLDFFLRYYLKDKVYATKPATVANLRKAIKYKCAQIPRKLLHDVSDSVAWRCKECLDQSRDNLRFMLCGPLSN